MIPPKQTDKEEEQCVSSVEISTLGPSAAVRLWTSFTAGELADLSHSELEGKERGAQHWLLLLGVAPFPLSTRLCAQHLMHITSALTIAHVTSQEIEVPRKSSYTLKITQFQGPEQLSSQAACSQKQSVRGQPLSYPALGLRVGQVWVACFRVIMERWKGSSKANKAFCGQPCAKEEGQGARCPGEDGRTARWPALPRASVTHTPLGVWPREAVLWWIWIRLGGLSLNPKTWAKQSYSACLSCILEGFVNTKEERAEKG